MGFIASLFGKNTGSILGDVFGNDSGTGFKAQGANLADPSGLAQQQDYINKLNAQHGIGNQSDVFNQQQNFLNAMAAQNGLANQSSVYNQLQAVASGQGPNPAQAMLDQATGQNVANQAALMAGQRGAGANSGLIARQAAQQGAATQQQAAGQGAILQANQSLGALNQLGGIAGQQVGQQQAQLGQIGNTAAQQVAQRQAALGQLTSGQLSAQQQQLQNIQQQNQANAGIAGVNAQAQQGRLSGLISGAGQALGAGFAHGGKVPQGEPKSAYARHMAGLNFKAGGHVPGTARVQGDSEKNDTVPALLSPGEIVIPRSILESKNPAAAAAKFVSDTLKKKGKK